MLKFHKVALGFSIVTACECKKFKWIQLQQVGFKYSYHLWVSLPFIVPKMLEQKAKNNN